jgi:hypothetical protein
MSELINSFAPEPELVINTDGGARGNPGPAGIGVVISTPEGRHLESFGKYIARQKQTGRYRGQQGYRSPSVGRLKY